MVAINEVLSFFKQSQSEVARAFGVSRAAVCAWVKRGKLPELRAYQFRDMVSKRATDSDR
jgi:predicted transcriptional regulator